MAIASLGFVAATETSVNPIRKVVTLMQEMQKEVEAEGETEKELFEKFMCYCKGNDEALKKQAADAAAAAEALTAKVESESGEKKQVDQDLKQAKTDRADAKADLEKASKLRSKEAAAYAESSADATANLEATGKAIVSLEKGMGGAFLQTEAGSKLKDVVASFADSMLESSDKELMASFLEQTGDYAPQSGQIVGILKNMKDEMEKDIGEAKSAEESAVSAFGELKAAKNKEIAATTEAVESLTKRSGELAVSVVENKGAAKDAEEEATDAAEFATNLKKTCADKQSEYDTNMATRAQEVEAIAAAIQILNEDDALDLFKKTLKTPKTVVTEVVGFMQVKVAKADKLTKAKAMIGAMSVKSDVKVALLQNTLKGMMSMNKVDFSKVLKMIDDMVTLLNTEQSDDEKSKTWCEKEFDTSDDTKKSLTGEVKALTSSISEMKDEIAGLATQIAETTDRIAALDKSVAEASAQRKSENAEFTAATAANNMAIELIGKAKNKLMQFYNPDLAVTEEPVKKSMGDMLADGSFNDNQMTQAAAVPAFVQLHASMKAGQPGPAPETATYSSKAQGSSTITALMDQLAGELKTGNQNMQHEEKTAQGDYEELLADAEKSKKEDSKSIMDKKSSKADLEESMGEAKRTHTLKAEALSENAAYIADLHKSCDFILANFEERRDARTNEVEGLKKAKAVLSGADYSF